MSDSDEIRVEIRLKGLLDLKTTTRTWREKKYSESLPKQGREQENNEEEENDLLSSIQNKIKELDKDIDLAFEVLKTLEEQFGKENKVFCLDLFFCFF
jgi:hypothetical protein